MDPWTVGLMTLVALGLAAVVFGALFDRSRNKRAEHDMLAAPERVIPQFHPDSPAPKYLSELQARRRPPDAAPTDLTQAERAQVAQQIRDSAATTIGAGYLSRDFITDPASSWAVLDSPQILVCADPVESTRELLTILEKLILSRTPLVVLAPSIAKEVRSTLEVNKIRQTLQVLAVTATRSELELMARATRADIRSRSDLQAGYVLPAHLGTCTRWVSTAEQSVAIGGSGPSAGMSA